MSCQVLVGDAALWLFRMAEKDDVLFFLTGSGALKKS